MIERLDSSFDAFRRQKMNFMQKWQRKIRFDFIVLDLILWKAVIIAVANKLSNVNVNHLAFATFN